MSEPSGEVRNEYKMSFGSRFRLVRTKMKISQEELSKKANLTRNTITNLENFKQVKVTTVLRISVALGVSPYVWFLPDHEWLFWYHKLKKEGA